MLRRLATAGVLLVLVVLLTGCGGAAEPLPSGAGRGAAIYKQRCAGCHEPGLRQKGPSLEDAYTKFGPEKLEKFLMNPQSVLPGNKMNPTPMAPQDLSAVIEHMSTLK